MQLCLLSYLWTVIKHAWIVKKTLEVSCFSFYLPSYFTDVVNSLFYVWLVLLLLKYHFHVQLLVNGKRVFIVLIQNYKLIFKVNSAMIQFISVHEFCNKSKWVKQKLIMISLLYIKPNLFIISI